MSRSDLDGLGYRGKVVVITGGASGMGEAAARLLGELGATVHIADIAEPKVACASYTHVDLSDPASVNAAAASLASVGPIDFLFPIAGVPPHAVGALKCMLINYVGTRQFTEGLLPQVRDGGTVCLITSTAARGWLHHLAANLEIVALDPLDVGAFYEANPDKLRDGYSSSKELLTVWIHKAAIALAEKRRIRLNGIAPCATGTPFMEESAKVLGETFMQAYPHPLLGRMPTGEEQAWSLLLLSSPLNAAVTGAVLATDEGNVGGMITGALTAAYVQAR